MVPVVINTLIYSYLEVRRDKIILKLFPEQNIGPKTLLGGMFLMKNEV